MELQRFPGLTALYPESRFRPLFDRIGYYPYRDDRFMRSGFRLV